MKFFLVKYKKNFPKIFYKKFVLKNFLFPGTVCEHTTVIYWKRVVRKYFINNPLINNFCNFFFSLGWSHHLFRSIHVIYSSWNFTINNTASYSSSLVSQMFRLNVVGGRSCTAPIATKTLTGPSRKVLV